MLQQPSTSLIDAASSAVCWRTSGRIGFFLVLMLAATTSSTVGAFVPTVNFNAVAQSSASSIALQMSLKPAAIPLMDSGKALARSGELLIDLTGDLDLYGGALSAAGALIRNSGDAVAQAAALCRFKTGAELACDEIREAATCLTEARDKLRLAVTEGEMDENTALVQALSE
jgi:hypothetical protein